MKRAVFLLVALGLGLTSCRPKSSTEAKNGASGGESGGAPEPEALWNGENPVPLMMICRSPDWALLEQVSMAGGMEIEVPEFGFPEGLVGPAESSRAKSREMFHKVFEGIEADAKPIFLFGDWLQHLPDRAWMDGILDGVRELIADEALGHARIILVEGVPRGGVLYHFDRDKEEDVQFQPDQVVAMRDEFLPRAAAIEGVEVAPFATVQKHVSETIPAWDTDIEEAHLESAALWAAVVFCTMTRREPPLREIQNQLAKWQDWDDLDGPRPKTFTALPPETLDELAAYILAAVREANKPG